MTLADADRAILDLHEKRLDRFEGKLDAVLGQLGGLAIVHAPDAPHNHTQLNCPLAERVSHIEAFIEHIKGGFGTMKLLLAVMGFGISIMGLGVAWLAFVKR